MSPVHKALNMMISWKNRHTVVLQEAKRRLEICLELVGERNERIEQLEDDIGEMKGIFRSQLSLAADQLIALHQASQRQQQHQHSKV